MYLERLLPENVRHLAPVEQVFSDGPQQIRRWTLLSAGAAATARLRCLALASLGRWQMSRLAERVLPLLAADADRPVRVEFVLIRHAPQERVTSQPVAASSGLAPPGRRRMGSAAASGVALPGAGRPARSGGVWPVPDGATAAGVWTFHPGGRGRLWPASRPAVETMRGPVRLGVQSHGPGRVSETAAPQEPVSGRARPGGAGPVEGRLERLARLGRGAEPGAGRDSRPGGSPPLGRVVVPSDGGARHRAPCVRCRRPSRGDRSPATAWRGAV